MISIRRGVTASAQGSSGRSVGAGSGANPARPLPSFAVALPGGERVAAALRGGLETPVFTRILNDHVLIDMRTLQAEDLEEVANLVIGKLGS